ncbi:hypothetical protein BLNAU_14830 [Blattamonas nauphoetae]|uniref:Uncharacterized protein n=1 Tax=Blattamonas nauphoetae TaxID=2049346 RepID=A0ABQ9XJ00_9EUKA|nr:hypothetical protein BLNAU_14830 [Blattamonas nauphoetae]
MQVDTTDESEHPDDFLGKIELQTDIHSELSRDQKAQFDLLQTIVDEENARHKAEMSSLTKTLNALKEISEAKARAKASIKP